MPTFDAIEGLLIQQLTPATAAVISGNHGCGKTFLAGRASARFDGRVLQWVAQENRQLLLIHSSDPELVAPGECVAADDLWCWFLSRSATTTSPWLIVIDNAHLLPSLRKIVTTFYQLAEAGQRSGSLLLAGLESMARNRQLRSLCPVWIHLHPGILPAGDESANIRSALGRLAIRADNPLRQLKAVRQALSHGETGSEESVVRDLHRLTPSRWRCVALATGYALIAASIGWILFASRPLPIPVPWGIQKAAVPAVVAEKITDRPAGERSGMQGLISTWGYDVTVDQAWCDRIEVARLRCESGTSSLEKLSQQGLPWMALLNVEHQTLYGVVMRVGDNTLDLLVNQRLWTVQRSWFEHVWQGRYTVLLRSGPHGEQAVTPKSGPEQIVWLDSALSRALSVPTSQITRWKPALTEKVKLFQRQQHLPVDGIVGKSTLVRLYQALGESPRLQAGNEPSGEKP